MRRHLSSTTCVTLTSSSTSVESYERPSPIDIQVADVASVCKQLAAVGRQYATLAKQQRAVSKTLMKWCAKDDNAAVRDIGKHVSNILSMSGDRQAILATETCHAAEALRKMCDADTQVDKQLRRIRDLEREEIKLKKEIERGPHRWLSKGGDIKVAEKRLEEVWAELNAANRELEVARDEQQVVRMFRLRQGLQTLASAEIEHAHSSETIYNTLRELSECVPAISTQNVRTMTYTAGEHTHSMMERLRRNNDDAMAQRRRSAPLATENDAPPPYSSLNRSDGSTGTLHAECPQCSCTIGPRTGSLYVYSKILPSAPPLQ